MIDENGFVMSEKQIIKEALDQMAEVCCLLFETSSSEGYAASFMSDALIKYLQVIYRDDDVLLAAADFNTYENEVWLKSGKHLRTIK